MSDLYWSNQNFLLFLTCQKIIKCRLDVDGTERFGRLILPQSGKSVGLKGLTRDYGRHGSPARPGLKRHWNFV